MRRSSLTMFLLLFLAGFGWGQGVAMRQEAHQLSQEGEALMLEANYKGAIAKFSRAVQLDEKNAQFKVQLARARYFDKDYAAAMEILRPMLRSKSPSMEAFQLYGNCQDETGQDYEALETYRDGLKHFPGSGVLLMEMGILEFSRHRDSTALVFWEQGIRAQPTYASNYYYAAKSRFESGDYAWACIYAETFINLERIGDRVRELSKLIYSATNKARTYDYVGVFHWKFEGRNAVTPLHQHMNDAFTSALPDTAWVPDIPTLCSSRRFAAFYVPAKLPNNPAEGLFTMLQAIAAQGYFDAYNYWLFYDACPEEFFTWYDSHKAQYEAFESWFLRNPFQKTLRKPIVR